MKDLRISQLVYGIGTVGKTAYLVSSFWDWQHGKALRNGRIITVGRERNQFLGEPEEAHTLEGGKVSLRLGAPGLDNMDWVDKLNDVLSKLIVAARRGQKLDVLCFDGFTETGLLHEATFRGTHPNDTKDKFAPWAQWRRDLFSIWQRLDPDELGCHILASARAGERKKAIVSVRDGVEKVISEGDDETLMGGFDYYPLLSGGLKYYLPNYFEFVSFMDVRHEPVKTPGGVGQSVVQLHALPGKGEFYVHNKASHLWKGPGVIVNPTFDQFVRCIVGADGEVT